MELCRRGSAPHDPTPGIRASPRGVRLRAGVALSLLLCAVLALAAADLDRLIELARERYGAQAAETVTMWRALLERSQGLSEREKLEAVNTFFNRNVLFEEDAVTWQTSDYWATPLETLGRGQGDCEDFSIGKYVSLGLLGVPIDRLRITYVRAELGLPGSGVSQAHMVLAYYETPDAEPLVLDNLVSELRPASRLPDLRPVFGFNSQGLWVAGTRAPAAKDPTARLSRWRDLLSRMSKDGLN
jgi:predicted transglutaminase-like cysteine proteinase